MGIGGGEFTPVRRTQARCMGRLFKQRPRYSAIDAAHRLPNFRTVNVD